MRFLLCLAAWLLFIPPAFGQTPTPTGPYPNGMRVVVGGSGALLRNSPNVYSCGNPPHPAPNECTQADVMPPGVYGVVQPDPPVLDVGGAWYWVRITFDAKTQAGDNTGWASAFPPYVNMLSPPQMISGINMTLVSDYLGPALVSAVCIFDGVNRAATMQLQNAAVGHQGTLSCAVPAPGVGNHKAVIQAVNGSGTAASPEFQFAVTQTALQQPPSAPTNLRIGSASGPTPALK